MLKLNAGVWRVIQRVTRDILVTELELKSVCLFFVACAFWVDGSDFQNVQTQRLLYYTKMLHMVSRWGYFTTLLGECTLNSAYWDFAKNSRTIKNPLL